MPLISVVDEPAFQSLSDATKETIRKAEAEGVQEIEELLASLPPELADMLAWMTTLPGRFIKRQLPVFQRLDEYEVLAARWLGLGNRSKSVN